MIDREGHDGSIVEESNGRNYDGWEVELLGEGVDGKTNGDTNGDGAGIDRVVPHALEDDTGAVDCVNNGGETGFSQNNICSTTGSVGGTLDDDTNIGMGQGRPWFASSTTLFVSPCSTPKASPDTKT